MQWGVCASRDKAAILTDAGYDYIELSVAGDLSPDTDEPEWQTARAEILALPIPVRSFNLFLRGGRITGPDADFARLRRYVPTALRRAREVGGETVVFGSGGARRVPDGFSRTTAEKQIRDFLNLCADAGDETGVTVVIEPLNHKESNILNSIAEAAAFAAPLNRTHVRVLADSYHMETDTEPVENIVEFDQWLAHVHTADTSRRPPGTGTYDHGALFDALRRAKYDGKVSIECSWDDLAMQAAPALVHLKAAHARANTST